jgi:hypothetical protein
MACCGVKRPVSGIRQMLGAQRIRTAEFCAFECGSQNTTEGGAFCHRNEPAESSLRISRGGIDQDAGHWVAVRDGEIDPFSQRCGVVPALKRKFVNKQMR